jgi:hypothetical protein
MKKYGVLRALRDSNTLLSAKSIYSRRLPEML